MDPQNQTDASPAQTAAVSSKELLAALATKCEQRADEWSACAVYRDRETCENIENIETMLRDFAKDLKAICAANELR
jgi:hypothetical protein